MKQTFVSDTHTWGAILIELLFWLQENNVRIVGIDIESTLEQASVTVTYEECR